MPRPRKDDDERSLSSQTYWEKRFQATAHQEPFEWLGSGENLVNDALALVLVLLDDDDKDHHHHHRSAKNATPPSRAPPPRALNIGSGTSLLSHNLRTMYTTRGWSSCEIFNVDYAPSALTRSKKNEEKEFGNVTCSHVLCDLLKWNQVKSLQEGEGEGEEEGVALILDKSTSDCISTLEDLPLPLSVSLSSDASASTSDEDEDFPPTLHRGGGGTIAPLEMLAHNLAGITRPGAIWAILSYSETRDEIVTNEGKSGVDKFWKLVRKYSVPAPSGRVSTNTGGGSHVHMPSVSHWCYFLVRL